MYNATELLKNIQMENARPEEAERATSPMTAATASKIYQYDFKAKKQRQMESLELRLAQEKKKSVRVRQMKMQSCFR